MKHAFKTHKLFWLTFPLTVIPLLLLVVAFRALGYRTDDE